MPSSEEENAVGSQKRPRACDICRRKKVRCNGPEKLGGECTKCTIAGYNCTYLEVSTRRVPSKKYIASLERRLQGLDRILQQLRPDGILYEDWINTLDEDGEDLRNPSHLLQQPLKLAITASPVDIITTAIRTISLNNPPFGDDEHIALAGPKMLNPETDGFFGKSSGEMLIRAALNLKSELVGEERGKISPVPFKRRQQFWTTIPWEIKPKVPTASCYTFPDPSLAPTLVDLYFENVNLYLPVLHRHSFQRSVQEGLHYVDDGFATTYMLVCSIGARFSDDPRAFLEDSNKGNSSGFKWFDQVQALRASFQTPPTLYALQDYCLSALFVTATSSPSSVWSLVGIGIRLAQDVGAHRRRKPADSIPTTEHELRKRAFWVLLILDRICSASLGRPLAILEEDYDLDLPIDCDDEYWEHPDPEKRFKQPPNKPSLVSAFRMHVKLIQLLTYCVRGIYSLGKTNARLGLVGEEWKSQIVSELDSSLNKWFNALPEHLKWDPDREDIRFFNLSGMLHATYYNCRILIHHSFIRMPTQHSPLPFPSLTICINAARACTQIAYALFKRNTMPLPYAVQASTLTSALVLIFNLWRGKSPGVPLERNSDLANVEKCFQFLQAGEDRWQQRGRKFLRELISIGDLALVGQAEGSGTNTGVAALFGPEKPQRPETSQAQHGCNQNAENDAGSSEDQHSNLPTPRLFLGEISQENDGLRVLIPMSEGDLMASSTSFKVSEYCFESANASGSSSTGTDFFTDVSKLGGVHEGLSSGSNIGYFGCQRGEQSDHAATSQQQDFETHDGISMWPNALAGFGSGDLLATLNNATHGGSSNWYP